MKSIQCFITEAIDNEFAEMSIKALMNSSLKKEQIVDILKSYGLKAMKKISDWMDKEWHNEYFPYKPQNDEFLKPSNIDSISNKMAEAIYNKVKE